MILLALIAVVALGAGGWYAVTSLGLLGGGEREIISAPHAAAPLPAGARETAEPGVQRTIPAVQPGEEAPRAAEARSVASAQAPSEPRYTRADVPRLVAQADRALSAGNPRDAVEVLVAAQAADPVNFDLIERLEAARSELNAAKEAQSRLEAGRVAFRQGQFDEALRIFYRVPAGHRPPQLDSWIALGWYNLGVRSLQTGNTHEALQFFNDSLDHAPGDPLTARNREVAIRYTGRKRDEAYRIYVQSLRTRKLPE